MYISLINSKYWVLFMTEDKLRKLVREREKAKKPFYVHVAIYIIVNIFLDYIWFYAFDTTEIPWLIYPLVGWGIGLFAHGYYVFGQIRSFVKALHQSCNWAQAQDQATWSVLGYNNALQPPSSGFRLIVFLRSGIELFLRFAPFQLIHLR